MEKYYTPGELYGDGELLLPRKNVEEAERILDMPITDAAREGHWDVSEHENHLALSFGESKGQDYAEWISPIAHLLEESSIKVSDTDADDFDPDEDTYSYILKVLDGKLIRA